MPAPWGRLVQTFLERLADRGYHLPVADVAATIALADVVVGVGKPQVNSVNRYGPGNTPVGVGTAQDIVIVECATRAVTDVGTETDFIRETVVVGGLPVPATLFRTDEVQLVGVVHRATEAHVTEDTVEFVGVEVAATRVLVTQVTEVITEAVAELKPSDNVKVIAFTDLEGLVTAAFTSSNTFGVSPAQSGAHSGEWETSLMLALRPGQVKMDQAAEGFVGPLSEIMEKVFGGIHNLDVNGVLGDPRPATAEAGKKYLEDIIMNTKKNLIEILIFLVFVVLYVIFQKEISPLRQGHRPPGGRRDQNGCYRRVRRG